MSEAIEKILDKLPYADGSGRRRLISGGVLFLGLMILFYDQQKLESIVGMELKETDHKPFYHSHNRTYHLCRR